MTPSSNAKQQPLVTIITPSYNQARFLPATYESVICQDYPNIEYFIIDGGSTDGSAELIKNWAEKKNNRISWWISEKDNGQADAINKGLARANGEIVAWLNSDDIYMVGAVTKAVEIFKEQPNLGLIFSNVFSNNAEGEFINAMVYGDWGLEELLAFNIIGQPGIFMRKAALDKVGGLDLTYNLLLDHQLWLRIASQFPIKHVNDYFAAARMHPAAKNMSLTAGYGKEALEIVDWIKSRDDLVQIYKRNHRKIVAGAYRLGARYLLDGGDNTNAFKQYMKSMWACPRVALKESARIGFSLLGFLPLVERMKANFFKKRMVQLKREKIDALYLELSNFKGKSQHVG